MRVNMDKTGNITIFDFSPAQAYKIAVRMEKDGIDFYAGILLEVKSEETKHEIEFLISQEKNHLTTFQDFLDNTRETAGDSFEEDDIVSYMQTHVFDKSSEKKQAESMEHRHTALEEALNLEKRSIVFYEGCLLHSKDKEAQKAFKNILEEERNHLKKFAELLRVKCINSQKGCLL